MMSDTALEASSLRSGRGGRERLSASEHGALILGVTRQRVSQLAKRDDFPAPAKVIGRHRLWRREDVQAWFEAKPKIWQESG
jgi:predicted DNA-binding transcriptional regulator AlpA